MNKQLATWQLIHDSLTVSTPVMLMYVLQSYGSSPGREGFLMAVTASGIMSGSIGGGIMEYKFVERCKKSLLHEKTELLVTRQVHDKKAPRHQSGMICSGEQTLLLYRPQPHDLRAVAALLECLSANREGFLTLSTGGITFSENSQGNDGFYFQEGSSWRYQRKIGCRPRLYIIGAGHCSLAFSKIMQMLDFYIVLIDDRPHLNTFLENDSVHEKIAVEDYTRVGELVAPGDHHYVVVMTNGYRTDAIVIKALEKTNVKYLGVLGSRHKIEQLFSDLEQQGFSREKLEKIQAPVGITINSRTPEEIAISIAAAIIEVKNRKEGYLALTPS